MKALYLVEPGSHLEADRRDFALIISTSLNNPQNDAIAHRQPIRETQQIVIFAGCTVGRTASRAIDRYRIPFSFIGDKGSITAHNHLHETPVYAPLQQERNRDREFCLAFAQSLLRGRWYNAAKVLRDANAKETLDRHLDSLPALSRWNALQAWHAETRRCYRKALLSVLESIATFEAARTLAFALLSRELSALLHHAGCSAAIGTLHKHCQNHQPLPCDLMEQFRPVVEAWLLSNAVVLDNCATFVRQWEIFMASAIAHPYIGKTNLRDALAWQVNEYVRAIAETADYRPFLLK